MDEKSSAVSGEERSNIISQENFTISPENIGNDEGNTEIVESEKCPHNKGVTDQLRRNTSITKVNTILNPEDVDKENSEIAEPEECSQSTGLTDQTLQDEETSIAEVEKDNSGSDSESELHATESLRLSDSDAENISPVRRKRSKLVPLNESDEESPKTHKKKTVPKDFDSESDLENKTKILTKNKLKELCSSESESEDAEKFTIPKEFNSSLVKYSDGEEEADNNEEGHTVQGKRTKQHQRKVAAKPAMKEIIDIKSENQRLSRESYIRVPYHKPKQHTLKEFLTRKTIAKPGTVKSANLKMSQEELKEFAKHLEERAKEASEFFKSDSENEEEDSKVDESISEKEEEESKEKKSTSGQEDNKECNLQVELRKEESENKVIEDIQKEDSNENQTDETDKENCEETAKPNSNIQDLKKCIIGTELCTKTPFLKGDPNMLIDLETGDLISMKPNGIDNLLQRFLKSSSTKKAKSTDNVSILSTENGKIEITNVSVSLHDDSEITEQKPGSAHLKLKNDLKKIIAGKRKEELMKKSQGNKTVIIKNEKKGVEEEEDNESNPEIDDEKDDIDELEEEVMEIDENEELLYNEAEEADADDELGSDADDENSEADDSESEEDEELPEKKSKSRIITAFEDSDDDDTEKATKEIDDILKEPLSVDNDKSLWMDAEKKSSDDENELLELCSGRFEATQKTQKMNITQIPTTQLTQNVDESELLGLCSGTFNEDEKTEAQQNNIRVNNFESSDEEIPSETIKNKSKSRKKKKLGFSDDENESSEEITKFHDTEDEENIDEDGTDTAEVNEEEPPETYIDYDSEENEIEVKLTKNDRIERAEEFFENEAELSESDWGSADEDEKDLDRYDIELGDEEQFDKQKIQSELEQIHLRKMLDQDMREVKKIQEMLFEDEENDGIGRERRFKWKNSETGFSLGKTPDDDENNENNKTDDEENEEVWRKMRHDRELLLKEKIEKIEVEKSILAPVCSAKENVLSTSLKKITVVKTKSNSTTTETTSGVDSPFLISKINASAVRGSFLVRDKATLSKLASITKAGIDSDGAAGTVQISSGKTGNFVFATLSETEQVAVKRKSPDYSRKGEINVQIKKKQKVFEEVGNKKRLIDHLV